MSEKVDDSVPESAVLGTEPIVEQEVGPHAADVTVIDAADRFLSAAQALADRNAQIEAVRLRLSQAWGSYQKGEITAGSFINIVSSVLKEL